MAGCQENYGVAASGKRSVRWKLKQMMEAGRLTQEDGLYKFAGVPQQIMEDSKRWAKKKVGNTLLIYVGPCQTLHLPFSPNQSQPGISRSPQKSFQGIVKTQILQARNQESSKARSHCYETKYCSKCIASKIIPQMLMCRMGCLTRGQRSIAQ